jgi:hypothetical protein
MVAKTFRGFSFIIDLGIKAGICNETFGCGTHDQMSELVFLCFGKQKTKTMKTHQSVGFKVAPIKISEM